MNSYQIHLALTHVPVILSIVGVVVLAVAMIRKNDTLTKTSFYLFLFAGAFAIPVFFTGEGAEETVEHLPGVSEGVIEKHEELATLAFSVVSVAAIISVAGILLFKKTRILRIIRPLMLLLALTTAGIMAVTAHLGGQVRHTEIRAGFTTQSEKGINSDSQRKEIGDGD